MDENLLPTVADLTDEFVLEKCDYFTRVQLWPLRNEMNPRLWLENFLESEKRHARYLLNAFMYLSAPMIDQIVVGTVESLSRAVVLPTRSLASSRADWRKFVNEIRVVLVRGEEPRPTDSGFIFSRIARDRLEIPEDHILDSPEALKALFSGLDAPIVFLDDFVGSGNQFIDTWNDSFIVEGQTLSFRMVPAGQASFFYCPVLATTDGLRRIRRECPRVTVAEGNELLPRYNVFHPNSLVWPDDLRASATDAIQQASRRAGIPDLNGGSGDWRGYHKLGQTVGFAHGVPDATLPLFWWESDTWNPLKKRSQQI
jgi:hypothetical protein